MKLKQIIISLILIVSASSVTFYMQSCSSKNNVDVDKNTLSSVNKNTWQQQLKYALNKKQTKSGNETSSDEISLIGYTYKGIIKSDAEKLEIIEDLFSANSSFAQYKKDGQYGIVPIHSILQKSGILGDDNPFKILKSQLMTQIEVGMEIIELKWEYKGKIYYSTAIASNEQGGIIYDNIGHFIIE